MRIFPWVGLNDGVDQLTFNKGAGNKPLSRVMSKLWCGRLHACAARIFTSVCRAAVYAGPLVAVC